MPRPPKKKTRVLAKAHRKGELSAEQEHAYANIPSFFKSFISILVTDRKGKKAETVGAWTWFNKQIDQISVPKLIAVAGMTVIVKKLIDTGEGIRERIINMFTPIWEKGIQPRWVTEPYPHIELWGTKKVEDIFPDWAEWLIAFTIAYFIVEHGDAFLGMLGNMFGDLTGAIKFLLGMAV